MGLGIPPLRIKIMLESNPLKSTMLVGGLGVCMFGGHRMRIICIMIILLIIIKIIIYV